MADNSEISDVIENNDGQDDGGSGGSPNDGAGAGERPEKRIKKLLNDNSTLLRENRTLKFENEFTKLSQDSKYAAASEFKSEIQQKVDSGMSTQDAVITVLHGKGKLGAEDPAASDNAPVENAPDNSAAAGGSADNPGSSPVDRKDPKDMTQAERLEALNEAEAKGELTLD